ncbi:26260_t:CDS:2 [Gigaspora margarita]|uniref:26260_t:CDS:1 n=1 Tax=Gigaspora margarita TaxID=4874 RepID=A0ABN7UL84_GIGMA|nr:26260_t:CDS:2 [Gigaspora margarita]
MGSPTTKCNLHSFKQRKENLDEPELEEETLEQLIDDEIRREANNNNSLVETVKPLPTILKNSQIDMPCTLLDMPLFLYFSKNKNNDYPLIDLTLTCTVNSSLFSPTSPNLLLPTLIDRNCPIEQTLLFPIQVNGCQSKEILILPPSSIPSTPSICYDPNFDNIDQEEWYSNLDFGTINIETDEFASDANEVIDENNRQSKIK